MSLEMDLWLTKKKKGVAPLLSYKHMLVQVKYIYYNIALTFFIWTFLYCCYLYLYLYFIVFYLILNYTTTTTTTTTTTILRLCYNYTTLMLHIYSLE